MKMKHNKYNYCSTVLHVIRVSESVTWFYDKNRLRHEPCVLLSLVGSGPRMVVLSFSTNESEELIQLTNQRPGNKLDVNLSSGLSRV